MSNLFFFIFINFIVNNVFSCFIQIKVSLLETPNDSGDKVEIFHQLLLNNHVLVENETIYDENKGENCNADIYLKDIYVYEGLLPCLKGQVLQSKGVETDDTSADDLLWDITLLIQCDNIWKESSDCSNGGGARLSYRCGQQTTKAPKPLRTTSNVPIFTAYEKPSKRPKPSKLTRSKDINKKKK